MSSSFKVTTTATHIYTWDVNVNLFSALIHHLSTSFASFSFIYCLLLITNSIFVSLFCWLTHTHTQFLSHKLSPLLSRFSLFLILFFSPILPFTFLSHLSLSNLSFTQSPVFIIILFTLCKGYEDTFQLLFSVPSDPRSNPMISDESKESTKKMMRVSSTFCSCFDLLLL